MGTRTGLPDPGSHRYRRQQKPPGSTHTNHSPTYGKKQHKHKQKKTQKNIICWHIQPNASLKNTKSTKNKTSDKQTTWETGRGTKANKGVLKHMALATSISQETDVTLQDEQDLWGHHMSHKPPNTIWILLQNIGGIDTNHKGSVKLAALHEFMVEHQVNITAITESNVAWSQVEPELLPQEQMQFWWENSHWSLTYNRQDLDAAKYQPGGACLVMVNQLSHWAQRPGNDTVGLGRWCWARLRGKNNQHLQLISAYCPCPSLGPPSTYQQQVRYWSSKRINCCPREKWLTDLQHQILLWQEEGNYIVLLADMNKDVISKDIQQFCQELNLIEAISTIHGWSPIPTHQWGSKAIDGIYVSPALLEYAEGGILALGSVTPSNHRAIWLDIKAMTIVMDQQDQVVHHQCRRLKCHDPRVVERYTKSLEAVSIQLQVEEKVESLYQIATTRTWTKQQEAEYNELDTKLTQAKLEAERQCRKICARRTPWTPAVTQAIQCILYWKGIAKCRHNGKISTTVLQRLATKGQQQFSENHWQLTPEQIKQKIKEAYWNYLQIKGHKDARDTWIGQLIAAEASAKNTTTKKL